MLKKLVLFIKKWRIGLLFAPLYMFIAMCAYWAILDREDPVILHNVEYTPSRFYDNDVAKSFSITYHITRTKECSAKTTRYLVSANNPSDIYYIGSIPEHQIDENIGVPITAHFEVELPDKLNAGNYNYYDLTMYSCNYNIIQRVLPLRVKSPMLPIYIIPAPKFSS